MKTWMVTAYDENGDGMTVFVKCVSPRVAGVRGIQRLAEAGFYGFVWTETCDVNGD